MGFWWSWPRSGTEEKRKQLDLYGGGFAGDERGTKRAMVRVARPEEGLLLDIWGEINIFM